MVTHTTKLSVSYRLVRHNLHHTNSHDDMTYILDTHVVWGVNFGAKNITAANLEARAIVEAFATPDVKDQGIILDAVEIGNEADLYRDNGQRPRNYTPAQYVEE